MSIFILSTLRQDKGVTMQNKWLDWAMRLQAIAQSGLFYSKDKYELERFQQSRDLSAEIISEHTDLEFEKVIDLFCCEKGYQTPKIDVRAVIIEKNQICLLYTSDAADDLLC